jgi:PEP-CTERM motif-containing protein
MRNFVNAKTLSMVSLAFLTLLLVPSESKATLTGICNPDGPGQCSASVSLSGNILTISLTNTSPALNGGFITAAAFDFTAGTTIVGGSFTTSDSDFVFTQGAINVAPDGTRNAMFSSTNNPNPAYEGGGNPNGGTPVGATVTFSVTLSSLNGNTETAIFNSLLVRQRGFEDGGSDKDNLTQVPEPASMLLLGSALMGFATRIRRRRKLE